MGNKERLDDLLAKAANGGLKSQTKHAIKKAIKQDIESLKSDCEKEPKTILKKGK